MKKAIITGATGLVGMAVARHLSSAGIELLCTGTKTFRDESVPETFGCNVTYLTLPMEDAASLQEKTAHMGWSPGDDCVFFNFAWRGRERLTDGSFSEQLTNAIHAAAAVRTAKQLGCTRYVNAGTLEETFVERSLQGDDSLYRSPQTNYALAKLASRDMCAMVAYLEKIDYVHTRLSVPVSRDFSQGTYVASTVRNILEGKPYQEPENTRPSDIVFLDDVARAYRLIGQGGKNKADYFIGGLQPATLGQYFQMIKQFVDGDSDAPKKAESGVDVEIFDTAPVYRDTGFVAITVLEDVIRAAMRNK
jgi:UDP-glucose 4-epimerase